MKNIVLIFKGFLIGLANIVPGLSGGTMAVSLNIYEELLDTIGNFMKNIKKNISFLGFIFIGMGLALIVGSSVMLYFLDNYLVGVTCFFVGLILGGVPLIVKKSELKLSVKNISYFVISFLFLIFISTLKDNGTLVDFSNLTLIGFVLLFLVGVIASGTMVIPGISGSFILVVLGYYESIIRALKEFFHFENIASNFIVLFVFGIGVIVGIVLISKLMTFLFNKYKDVTYAGILGIITSSIFVLLIPLFDIKMTFGEAFISILMIDLGFVLTFLVGGRK